MKPWIICSIVLVVVAAQPAVIGYGQSPVKPAQAGENWQIRWSVSDEFTSATPDWKKWIRQGGLPTVTAWSWDNDRNVSNSGGVAELVLRPVAEKTGGKRSTWLSSGILKSYRTFTYGFFEARIKGADVAGSGVCPSFWLFSNFDDKVADGETVYCEIDVVEMQQFDWLNGHQDDVHDLDLNLHCVVKENGRRNWRRPKAFPKEQLNKWRAPWDPRADFHVYGCQVSREEIVWFVDGREVARKPNTHWHRPMHIALSLGARKPLVRFQENRNVAVDPETSGDAAALRSELPATMQVDYVRVWEQEE